MFSRRALGLSVLVTIRIYRFLLHFEDLYMGAQVLCHPPNVGPPMNQRLCTATVLSQSSRAQPMCSSERRATSRETIPCRACAIQNGTDLVQADKHDLILVPIEILKEMCIQTPQSEHLS